VLNPFIFKANDIRGVTEGPEPEWDEAGAYALGGAFVEVFSLAGRSVVLGHDMRLSGPRMSDAFVTAVLDAGTDVVHVGLASTDELWFASGHLGLPGVMFTASHNPGRYNGIKFCHPGARPIAPDELVEIAELASSGRGAPKAEVRGTRSETDVLGAYAEHLHSLVDLTGIRPLRVVADAGSGMAGHTLPAVFPGGPDAPPVEIIGLYTEPDGNFPFHPANPLEPENLVDAQAAVREQGADLALVFDGDADRCFIIDERGEVVSPSAVTALIASQELDRHPGSAVVVNNITSRSVAEVVAEHGGSTVVTKVGHTFVKAAMAEHDAVFGGEHSAHYYFREFWGADTGMLAALHPLRRLGGDQLHRVRPGRGHRGRGGRVRGPGRGRPPRRADGQRAGLVGQRPSLQHRAAAAPQRRGPDRGADGRAARRGPGRHPRLARRTGRSGHRPAGAH
jgi:phosphomannomutase